jgi:hypothetical protein
MRRRNDQSHVASSGQAGRRDRDTIGTWRHSDHKNAQRADSCGQSCDRSRVVNSAATANSGVSRDGLPPARRSTRGGHREPHPPRPSYSSPRPARVARVSHPHASPTATNPAWSADQAAMASPDGSPQHAAAGASVAAAATAGPLPRPRTPGGARLPCPSCRSTPSSSCIHRRHNPAGFGSATTAARRCAAHGACPAAR